MLGARELARDFCLRAAELAERLGDGGRLARAALIFSGPPRMHLPGPVTGSILDLLERALTTLSENETPLRARVMGRLAVALAYFPAHRERGLTLARDALATARRIAEPAALAEVLASTHWATWGPDNLHERLETNRELGRRATELGDGVLAAYAYARGASQLVELGDIEASERDLQQLELLADALNQRYPRWMVATLRGMRAALDGRLEDYEAYAREGLAVGQAWNEDTAWGTLAIQLLTLRWVQGRLPEALDLAERVAARYAEVPSMRTPPLALCYAELGRDEDARAELEVVARADFADIPRDGVWLPAMWTLSRVAALLGDRRRAEQLYTLLLPYADRCVVAFSVICFGSASWPLGVLATTMSRFDEATQHFERALTMHGKIRSPLWSAHTQYDYASMLLLRCRPGDHQRAQALRDAALATAEDRGLELLANRARELMTSQ